MNKVRKILLYSAGIVLVYSMVATIFHTPVIGTGSLFFLLILACPLMMMFMMGGHNHSGNSDEKKAENSHQH